MALSNKQARVQGRGEPQARPEPRSEQDEIKIQEQLAAFVSGLERLADEQVEKKSQIEDRWYVDLRQYHGKYDDDVLQKLRDAKKSEVFIGLTRAKTHSWEARLTDMLFPTDDKNWGIRPTPVPDLTDEAQKATEMAEAGAERANQMENSEQAALIAQEADQWAQEAAKLKKEVAEAKRRADLMEREMDDQLKQTQFQPRSREVIHDGCKLGTAILKGPLTRNRAKRKWKRQQIEGGASLYALEYSGNSYPEMRRVDPWNFFPDMSARSPEEWEFTFERHLPTKRELRKWAKIPGFEKDALRRLVQQGPNDDVPTYLGKLRTITGQNQNLSDRYVVWEYHGPIEHDDLENIIAAGKGQNVKDIEIDPLEELNVIIWFCGPEILKFSVHPLDSGDSLYSVWNFERDETSCFGYGVPYLMRDSQRVMNGSWRGMMDNMGLSVGPQLKIDKTVIEPADGSWDLTPRKVWWQTKPLPSGSASPFEAFDIPSHQGELANIIGLARQLADEETNMPAMAQGEPGTRASTSQGTETMGGMAMLMNSANVVFRRVVRNWDDDMTVPTLTRLYDWNMQFNDKEEIKGDMEIDARGSSVLLVRELQTQNLMKIVEIWSAHPVLSQLVKVAPAARKTVQGMMIAADDVIKTDDELKQEAQQAQNQPPEKTPEDIKLEIAQIDAQSRLQVAQMDRETELIKLAEQQNMQIEELKAKLEMQDRETQSKERVFAAEAAMEQRRAAQAAKHGESPPESGGYI